MAAGVPPPWAPRGDQGGGAAARARVPPPRPTPPRPAVAPQPPPQQQPPLTDAWWGAAREDVLARLRAEAAATSSAGGPLLAAAAASLEEAATFEAAAADLAAALGLGTGRAADATHVARAAPGLLALPKATLVQRVLALKTALPPGVDAGSLAARAPFLLAEPDGGAAAARVALAQLAALMPGVDVGGRLAGAATGGGSFWMSFADLARQAVADGKRRR